MGELVGLIWGGPGAETVGDTRTGSQEGLRKGGTVGKARLGAQWQELQPGLGGGSGYLGHKACCISHTAVFHLQLSLLGC